MQVSQTPKLLYPRRRSAARAGASSPARKAAASAAPRSSTASSTVRVRLPHRLHLQGDEAPAEGAEFPGIAALTRADAGPPDRLLLHVMGMARDPDIRRQYARLDIRRPVIIEIGGERAVGEFRIAHRNGREVRHDNGRRAFGRDRAAQKLPARGIPADCIIGAYGARLAASVRELDAPVVIDNFLRRLLRDLRILGHREIGPEGTSEKADAADIERVIFEEIKTLRRVRNGAAFVQILPDLFVIELMIAAHHDNGDIELPLAGF